MLRKQSIPQNPSRLKKAQTHSQEEQLIRTLRKTSIARGYAFNSQKAEFSPLLFLCAVRNVV